MSTEISGNGAVRASDAERERVVGLLREHAGEGRLDVDELAERLDRAYAARTRADLEALTRDLPELPPKPPPARDRRRELAGRLAPFVAVNLVLVVTWALTGAGYFWPIWPILGWGIGLVSHPKCGVRLGANASCRGRAGHRVAA